MITDNLTLEQRAVIKGLGSKVLPKKIKENLPPASYSGEFAIKVAYRAERGADGEAQPTQFAFSKAAFIKLAAATRINHEKLYVLLETLYTEQLAEKEGDDEDDGKNLDEQLKEKYPAIVQTIELFESEVVAKGPKNPRKGSFLLKEVDVDLIGAPPKIVGDEAFANAHRKPAVQPALPLDEAPAEKTPARTKKSKSAARA